MSLVAWVEDVWMWLFWAGYSILSVHTVLQILQVDSIIYNTKSVQFMISHGHLYGE